MPRRRVHDAWKECLGRTRPLLLSDLRPNGKVMMRAQSMIFEQGRNEAGAVDDALFEEVAKPIARRLVYRLKQCAFGLKSWGCYFGSRRSRRR